MSLTFASRLKMAMAAHGWDPDNRGSRSRLAEAAKVGLPVLSRYLDGSRMPADIKIIDRIAKALAADYRWLSVGDAVSEAPPEPKTLAAAIAAFPAMWSPVTRAAAFAAFPANEVLQTKGGPLRMLDELEKLFRRLGAPKAHPVNEALADHAAVARGSDVRGTAQRGVDLESSTGPASSAKPSRMKRR